MEARLLKDSPAKTNACDYLLLSVDDQSFSYLNSGLPVRIAFAVDGNDHLPWNERKCMVVVIGKSLDFERYKHHKEDIFKKGLVDKSYLVQYIAQMKKKLVQLAVDELEIFDKQLQLEGAVLDNKEEAKQDPQPKPLEITLETGQEPKEYLALAQAAEMLQVSHCTLLNLAKEGKVKGECDGNGWYFIRSDIEGLLRESPEFLVKIWNSRQSIKMNGGVPKEITFNKGKYIHIKSAEGLLNLSCTTIERYVKAGLVKNKKVPGSAYYLSLKHIGELKVHPPDWLKKSWRYFNSQGQDESIAYNGRRTADNGAKRCVTAENSGKTAVNGRTHCHGRTTKRYGREVVKIR